MVPTMLSGPARRAGRRRACRRPSARASGRRRGRPGRRRPSSGWRRPRSARAGPRQNSWALRPGATGGDVGRGEVGGGGPEDRRSRGRPGRRRAGRAWPPSSVARRRAWRRREAEAVRDGELERGRAGVGQELLGRPHGGDQRRRAAHPAHLPAGEGERLAARGDGQRALAHAGQGGQRDVRAVEDQVLVDLVGHRQEVVGPAQGGDLRQLVGARTPCRSGCAAS